MFGVLRSVEVETQETQTEITALTASRASDGDWPQELVLSFV